MSIGLGAAAPVPLEHQEVGLQGAESRIGEDRPLAALDVDLHQVHVVVLGEDVDGADDDRPAGGRSAGEHALVCTRGPGSSRRRGTIDLSGQVGVGVHARREAQSACALGGRGVHGRPAIREVIVGDDPPQHAQVGWIGLKAADARARPATEHVAAEQPDVPAEVEHAQRRIGVELLGDRWRWPIAARCLSAAEDLVEDV
ncbi:MAG: hypothetical protein QOG40_2377, partial [Solirubrobacteraceae bacterium]|nr:hypothetical protein [Solirubrobacteraceae bacterium]